MTPTSYLELINTFRKLIGTKRSEVDLKRSRYQNGLQKLNETEEQVTTMQADLEAKQPLLKVAEKETAIKLEEVTKQEAAAKIQKDNVEADAAICNRDAAAAQAIKDECEEALAKAIPTLHKAQEALKTLKKSDIDIVKKLLKPPSGVRLTMEAICIMMGKKPKKIKDPEDSSKKIWSYWEVAQKEILSDFNFLKKLMDYDRDNIPDATVKKMNGYCANPDFTPEKIGTCRTC